MKLYMYTNLFQIDIYILLKFPKAYPMVRQLSRQSAVLIHRNSKFFSYAEVESSSLSRTIANFFFLHFFFISSEKKTFSLLLVFLKFSKKFSGDKSNDFFSQCEVTKRKTSTFDLVARVPGLEISKIAMHVKKPGFFFRYHKNQQNDPP